MPNWLDSLNPEQREAVLHRDGPLLILAGAGSGKTRVITHRIAHLISGGVPAGQILAVTFTNKAADEMRQRVSRLVSSLREPGRGDQLSGGAPLVTTFHSFCVQLLRRDYPRLGGRRDFVIYDASDQQLLLKGIYRQMGVDEKRLPLRNMLGRISEAKNQGLTPAEVQARGGGLPAAEQMAVLYERYQSELRRANALDFDDLLLEAWRLLDQSPETVSRCAETWRYLLVDEYQDTNRPQYELLRRLTTHHQNLCAVGDEDQSIYSWRGADIRNILDFERDFPNARVLRLERNYRSSGNILAAASALVAHNRARKGKTLWTESADGPPIGWLRAGDGEQEARFAAETLRAWQQSRPDATAAILYRINAQSRACEEALRRLNLRYRLLGGFSFYERAEIKDTLAYLKLALNPDDNVSFLRVVNTPARGVGKTTLERLEQGARERKLSLWAWLNQLPAQSGEARPGLEEFRAIVTELMTAAGSDSPPGLRELISRILDRTGYVRRLQQEDSPEAQTRLENLDELLSAAAEADDRQETPRQFLDHAALISDQDEFDSQAAITLMTLHAAKGLEFDLVLLVGMEEGLLPHGRALELTAGEAALEEERRLCYVGMTRARQQLYLTAARARRRYGAGMPMPQTVSRFISEMPPLRLQNLTPETEFDSGAIRYERQGYSQETRWREPAAPRPERGFAAKPSLAPAAARTALDAQASLDNLRGFFGGAGLTTAAELPRRDAAATSEPAPAPRTVAAGRAGWRPGMRVRHARYGAGTVLRLEGEADETKLTISFPGFGLKKMVLKYAQLEPA